MFKFKRHSRFLGLLFISSACSLGYPGYLGASYDESLITAPSRQSALVLNGEKVKVLERTQELPSLIPPLLPALFAQVSSPIPSQSQSDEFNTSRDYSPEAASRWTNKPGWTYPHEAVAAANPLAADAGLQMLKKGGNAVDAAVAVQMVLSLVEPQSSGIGGGGFMVVSKAGHVEVLDGREVAPQSATENLFLDDSGRPLGFKRAQLSNRSIGVPGIVAMLQQAHRLHGKLPWKDLIQPAIELCDNGFMVSQRLHQLLLQDKDLVRNSFAREYFYQPDLTPWPVGYKLKNPELSRILKDIATQGAKAFYTGVWAQAIVDTANNSATQFSDSTGGVDKRMSLSDLKNYRSLMREPLCFEMNTHKPESVGGEVGAGVGAGFGAGVGVGLGVDFKTGIEPGPYKVCGAPPPASGTLAMAQILGMLEHTPAKDLPFGAEWLHYYAEASRLALADRAKYVSDPTNPTNPTALAASTGPTAPETTSPTPYLTNASSTHSAKTSSPPNEHKTWQALISNAYLQERAKLIGEQRMSSPEPGIPVALPKSASFIQVGSMPNQPEHGTSHISVIDRFGGSVSFTTSIESAFGVHRMVNSGSGLKGGFLLNSELTDFSFYPIDGFGRPIANRPGPGKRPRSSMTPTIVLTGGKPSQVYASLGSPGGSAIIHFTAQTLWAMLEWGMSPQDAINLAHFTMVHPKGELILEQNQFNDEWLNQLIARKQTLIQAPLTSGVQAIERTRGGLSGGADPRREGVVLGR